MLIALDFDDTYTLDPDLWNTFILNALEQDHEVIIVTMRYEHEGKMIRQAIGHFKLHIIFTGRKAKKPFLEKLMIYPDVWIDDCPEYILIDV